MVNKMKTKKSLLRRVNITKTGKLLHGSSFKRHLRRNKSASQKRRYRKVKQFDNTRANKFKKALGLL